MKRYSGGTPVKGGYYWCPSRWAVTHVPGDAGILDAPASDSFVALPVPLLIVVAPVMGAVYAFYLPAIGFVMVLAAIARKFGMLAAPEEPQPAAAGAHGAAVPAPAAAEPSPALAPAAAAPAVLPEPKPSPQPEPPSKAG